MYTVSSPRSRVPLCVFAICTRIGIMGRRVQHARGARPPRDYDYTVSVKQTNKKTTNVHIVLCNYITLRTGGTARVCEFKKERSRGCMDNQYIL